LCIKDLEDGISRREVMYGTAFDCLESDVSQGTWHDDVGGGGGGGGDLALETGAKWCEGYSGFVIP
jgi:hypothetical protein